MKGRSLACIARGHAAVRTLFGLACGHWPLLHLRPPIGLNKASSGLPLGPQIDRETPGRHKTNLTLARTNDQLLYSRNCHQEPLMRNGRATLLCQELHLQGRGPPKKSIVTNKPLRRCMSSTFFGQRPLSCVTGYVNTDLSCFWLGFDLAVLLAFSCMHLIGGFSPGGFFHLQHTSK